MGAHRMPEHDAFAAVLAFARECASLQAQAAGSCPPYLPAAMVLAYNVRLRGIEVSTLTDAQILPSGILSNRRKGSRDNVTTWTDELSGAVQWLQGYRKEPMDAYGRPIPLLAKDRHLHGDRNRHPAFQVGTGQRLAADDQASDRPGRHHQRPAFRPSWAETPGYHRQR